MKKAAPTKNKVNIAESNEDMEKTVVAPSINATSSPRDLNSLRDIIFGPTLREQASRFRAIEREIERLRESSEERYAQFDTKLTQKFDELSSEVHKRVRELDKQINERIDQVTDKGEQDLRKLSTLSDNLAQELQDKIEKVAGSQGDQISELGAQMRRNYDTLRNELVSETDDLDERKLNRYAIADGLIELGMKLKDENLLDELNTQLADET